MILPQHDIIGQAGLDYFLNGQRDTDIKVWSDIAETDTLPVHYLFRSFPQMPMLEQKALMLCKGRVLDVGAGMGSHSLYLQDKGFDVTALELSPLACEVISRRGVNQIVNNDFFNFSPQQKFDTVLMMMNGIGLVANIAGLAKFFKAAKQLLNPGGQIILDSSDLRYLFLDDDGSMLINLNDKYYGEVEYKMNYENFAGKKFKWLFIDDELLAFYAKKNGFNCQKLAEGAHYDYLAKLSVAL